MLLFITGGLYAQNEQPRAQSHCTLNDLSGHNKADYMLRYGFGGFSDSRSEEDGLGGGQLALDIMPCN